jgi:hypothetical protein
LIEEINELLDNSIEEIKLPMLYKVIYREIVLAWKSAENLTQEKRMSYLEDGRHPMNTEIVDEVKSKLLHNLTQLRILL